MEFATLFFLSSGLFLGWSLGANDAANVFGTAVGSRMIRFSTAAVICSVFVILGAVMSSLASMLNAASTIFTMDLYRNYLHKGATQAELVVVTVAALAAIPAAGTSRFSRPCGVPSQRTSAPASRNRRPTARPGKM